MTRLTYLIAFVTLVFLLVSQGASQAQYLGCFKDTSNRDISARHWSSASMTVGKCVADCRSRGFRYAGVQYYSHCFCANSYGRYGRASNCTTKCSGNKSQTCGGSWANGVYATGASGGGNTSKQAFCQRYSNTAISQQRQNLSRQCGFRGARWQVNYNNHYNWCLRAANNTANSETNARNTQLRNCGGGSGGKQAFCQRYSNTAISQQRQNLSRQCGFRGARWQVNYNNHYNWCLRASTGSANSETNARTTQLRQCRPAQSRLFRSRWDKIGGPGGPWTTGWVPNHTQQICGHQHAGCRCGAGYCGNYRSGATTYWWPNGCQGPRWTIRCTSVPQ